LLTALVIAAIAFCRIAVPALIAPLELLEGAIPTIGEIADVAEVAATPAIVEGCVQGIEKEGKAESKVFGKEHTLDPDRPRKTYHPRRRTIRQKKAKALAARNLTNCGQGCQVLQKLRMMPPQHSQYLRMLLPKFSPSFGKVGIIVNGCSVIPVPQLKPPLFLIIGVSLLVLSEYPLKGRMSRTQLHAK